MKDDYLSQYKLLHVINSNYGSGLMHIEYILSILMALDVNKIIDYGCGKGEMAKAINTIDLFDCAMYDPSVPQYAQIPTCRFDALINTDVLEHIPEEQLAKTLTAMSKLADIALIIPHLDLANTILPDGTNAHCTIKTPDNWQKILNEHWNFAIRLYHHSSKHAFFLCSQHNQNFKQLILLSAQIAGTEFQKNLNASLMKRIKELI